ncbi:PIN domain-containing protein [Chromobacterium rhizoryzae]|uniref:PIN domain-containing protein n=1 Tax=Chromobacterium rhizoryzae TaxID=1778675 RepID=UPI0013C2DAD7|nr:PIN domain-containing protein [Chromobacterium rhizoryzae]
MEYGAITIDTSIFEKNGLKFDSGILKSLSQFKEKPAGIILSEIVINEIYLHLEKKVFESKKSIENALKDASHYSLLDPQYSEEISAKLKELNNNKEIALDIIKKFIHDTSTKIIHAEENIRVSELIKRYFSSTPPFADSGKKKNEFPDAIALLSLESYAEKKKTKVLAISTDKDWANFAATSNYIDVKEDLAEGIALFSPNTESEALCKAISREIVTAEWNDIRQQIEDAISDEIVDIQITAEADSFLQYEPDNFVEIEFIEFNFENDQDGKTIITPIQRHSGGLTIQAKIKIKAKVNTDFSFSMHDSMDDDDVAMGSTSAEKEIDFDSAILLTIDGNIDYKTPENIEPNEIEIHSIELLRNRLTVDFGHIQPDWFDIQPEEEHY